MSVPIPEETPAETTTGSSFLLQTGDLIRRHPIAAALATLGLGCVIGVVARELLTPPPRQRAMQLLEDIQARLAEYAEPAGRRIGHLAEDGAGAVKRGLHSVADSKLGHRFQDLFC